MKRLLKLWLLSLILLFISSASVLNANIDFSLVETGGAGYYIKERAENNQLDYGIKHYRDISETIRDNKYWPQQVNVIEVPNSTGAKIVSYADLSNHKWTRTTLTNYAMQYEARNPGWIVLAAINADFFQTSSTHLQYNQARNALMNDGEYYKTTCDHKFAVGFTNDGSTTTLIGQKPTRTKNMILAVYDENDQIIKEFTIHNLNSVPDPNQTSVYFGTYQNAYNNYVGINVPTNVSNTFVVENAELALPNTSTDFYGKGAISSTNSMYLNVGQFAIVTNVSEVANYLSTGVKIRVQYEFTGPYENATAITGFEGHFLKNSEHDTTNYRTDLGARHPRTTVGVKADGTIVMAVIDGRQSALGMEGVYGNELAAIMKKYGCTDAYNLDGGGSSTMAIRKNGKLEVVNSPSDGWQRSNANALLIVVREPEIDYEIVEKTENSITIKANVTENYHHQIDKLMVRVNMQTKEVVDGLVTFTGLRPNNSYNIDFYYRTPQVVTYTLKKSDKQFTLKRKPEFRKVVLTEDQTSHIFSLDHYDQDLASSILSAKLIVNGNEYNLTNGELVLEKSQILYINEVIIEYQIDIGDNNIVHVRILNPHFFSTMALNVIIDEQISAVEKLYK